MRLSGRFKGGVSRNGSLQFWLIIVLTNAGAGIAFDLLDKGSNSTMDGAVYGLCIGLLATLNERGVLLRRLRNLLRRLPTILSHRFRAGASVDHPSAIGSGGVDSLAAWFRRQATAGQGAAIGEGDRLRAVGPGRDDVRAPRP